MTKSTVHRLEKEFIGATSQQQRVFLMRLPYMLDLSPSDLALLKASETAFAFWDNPDDAAYDSL